MADISRKKSFPGLSPGTIKSLVFTVLVGIAIGFWLYTQTIFSHIREFQRAVVKTQVEIYLSIIDPRSTFEDGLNTSLFETAVSDT